MVFYKMQFDRKLPKRTGCKGRVTTGRNCLCPAGLGADHFADEFLMGSCFPHAEYALHNKNTLWQ
jgi:hypothetical protein